MPAVAELLDALAGAPNLAGAACTDHRDVFDACLGKTAARPGTSTTRQRRDFKREVRSGLQFRSG